MRSDFVLIFLKRLVKCGMQKDSFNLYVFCTHTEQQASSADTNVLGWKMQCSASAQSSRTLGSTQSVSKTSKRVVYTTEFKNARKEWSRNVN